MCGLNIGSPTAMIHAMFSAPPYKAALSCSSRNVKRPFVTSCSKVERSRHFRPVLLRTRYARCESISYDPRRCRWSVQFGGGQLHALASILSCLVMSSLKWAGVATGIARLVRQIYIASQVDRNNLRRTLSFVAAAEVRMPATRGRRPEYCSVS